MSAAQAEALAKNVPEQGNGEIWGTREIKGYFEAGAREIAAREREEGVGGVVHGDYKLDNLVRLRVSSSVRLMGDLADEVSVRRGLSIASSA